MNPGQRAEALITQYGISEPNELEIEAIALDNGLTVEYQDLMGCEATLAGFRDRAIATIKPSTIRGRERFSIGHELGHWEMHRGRSFRCRVDEPDQNLVSEQVLEVEADLFASHLLMPSQIFNPVVKSLGNPGFREIERLSEQFQTSMLATSFRLASINKLPLILACYSSSGLRWFRASADVPRRWFLKSALDEDSFAYDLIVHGKQQAGLRKQSGEVWFENDDADDYELLEHSMIHRNKDVLVVLYLSSAMFDAKFDPNVGVRRYTEFGSYVSRRPLSKT